MDSVLITPNPWISGIIYGLIGAVVSTILIPPRYFIVAMGGFIGAMAAIYWGFAVKSNSRAALFQETIFLILFSIFGSIVIVDRPDLVAIGIMAHGIYDCMFAFKIIKNTSHVPAKYPALCAGYDFAFAAFLLWSHGYQYRFLTSRFY